MFSSNMEVLVNGSATLNFKVGRGLHQGDIMSPFLFLLVTEGLAGLMVNVTQLGEFQAFKVNEKVKFELMKFVDDTILVDEGSWRKLWNIKTVMCGF